MVKNLGKLTLAVIATCLILTPVCQSGTVLTQTEWDRPHGTEGIHAWFDRRDTKYELFFRDSYDFNYGDPTPAEQAHLEAINRARANPMVEAARLGIDLYEGVPADAISGLPVQPLVMNANLMSAARLHSLDMIDHDYFAHASLDGTSPFVRMENAGYDYTMAGENLAFIGSTIEMNLEETTLALHDNLFVDEGYPDRGHRVNMLVEGYKEVGVGFILGEFRGYDHSYMLTCDFGTPRGYTGSFILGVVYDDRNSDNFYNIGEGVSNVIIDVAGAGSTQTASAGGYGIPVSSGEYTVTATLPEGQVAVRTVTIGAENRKIDFLRSEFTASPRVIGETSGIYTITATTDETLTLKLNTTNAAGDTPVYEWICLTVIPAAGPAYPIFILTESGLTPLSPDSALETLAWAPGVSPTFDLGTLSMADLGLTPGDALLYGYAYTASTPEELTLENLVTIRIVDP